MCLRCGTPTLWHHRGQCEDGPRKVKSPLSLQPWQGTLYTLEGPEGVTHNYVLGIHEKWKCAKRLDPIQHHAHLITREENGHNNLPPIESNLSTMQKIQETYQKGENGTINNWSVLQILGHGTEPCHKNLCNGQIDHIINLCKDAVSFATLQKITRIPCILVIDH